MDDLIGRQVRATVDDGIITDLELLPVSSPLFSRENIDKILSIIPKEARCCYTGQSILAYVNNPTFSWDEVNAWPDETDVDIFVYSQVGLAALIQLFLDNGWEPISSIDTFKSERIRFWEPNRKFNLQTVALNKPDLPIVNLTWYNEGTDLVSVVKRFDMDYLMVGMDCRTKTVVDLRGPDHRIANVNHLNTKFDVTDVDVMFWVRQFDRCPKGYARGIDTRPVAQQYIRWLDEVVERGDWAAGSKTRFYAGRKMDGAIAAVVESGFTQEQAESLYHLVRGEDSTWEAMRLNYETIRKTMAEWLASVEND
jgi:hypothetical protein